MAELKAWQRVIQDPKEAKEGEWVSWYADRGFIASDMNNEEYKKNLEAKYQKRKDKKAEARKRLEARIQRKYEMGVRDGEKKARGLVREMKAEMRVKEAQEKAKVKVEKAIARAEKLKKDAEDKAIARAEKLKKGAEDKAAKAIAKVQSLKSVEKPAE